MKIYQVDAFTDHVFGGNPAAVCPLEEWLSDDMMQQIAKENNLSETAFFVKERNLFHIRWFTPEMEIDLCGHATLASAHVIFSYLNYIENRVEFKYGGGSLFVVREDDLLTMDFPSVSAEEIPVTEQMVRAIGKKPLKAMKARDLLLLYESEQEINEIEPDFGALAEIEHLGVIVTAPGINVDFVSRFFAPRAGINEDPVTGSAHCMLIPFWAEILGKNTMKAKQLSARVGELYCQNNDDRVLISGKAVTYMIGELVV
jgi:PhzF family phenazine biosynthesis protein